MRKALFLLLLLPSLLVAQTPQRDLLHFGLKEAIANAAPGSHLPVYLRGDAEAIISFVRNEGGTVRGTFNQFISVSLPVAAFAKISAVEGIAYVEFKPWKPEALSDVVLPNNNVLPVHQGLAPLPAAYLGTDVVIGFIDTGIEINHPDFQHPDGSTRVIALWDQTQPPTDLQRVPQPFNYGQEWTAEDIDAGITNHDDQSQFFGHGSTVTGVAVGNANATGDFLGVAPEADIMVVSSNFNAPNWTMTVAEGVEWIFARAAAIGKPAVVNASLGDYLGSHDALDAAALHIESLLDAAPGRAMVCAAGNSNAWAPYHLGYSIPEADTAFTWFVFNPNALGSGAVFLEAWTDVAGFENTQFTIGADVISPTVAFRGYAGWRTAAQNLNVVIQDTIRFNNAIIGIVQSWVGQRGDQYQIQMVVTQPFSAQFRWRFASTGGGRIDCWSRAAFGLSDIVSTGLPSAANFPAIAQYRLPDKLMTMVDSWACSEKVITVANYKNQQGFLNYQGTMTMYNDGAAGDLSPNSSSGPTRSFHQKPDIASTGDVVLSAGRLANIASMVNNNAPSLSFSGMHYVNGGTSMASPVVAAAAALYLQRCPLATHGQIMEAIIATALSDPFTGVLPHVRWGNGKLNVFDMLTTTVAPISVTLPSADLCEGETAVLIAQGGLSNYTWSNDATGAVMATGLPGTYTVDASDARQCVQRSAPATIEFLESPDVPVINLINDVLVAQGVASQWQWYLNGEAIPDAESDSFLPLEEGDYQVEAIAENGCRTFSAPFVYGVASANLSGESLFFVYPNPAQGAFSLAAKTGVERIRLFDLTGKVVIDRLLNLPAGQQATVEVNGLTTGVYIAALESSHGTHHLKIVIEK